MEEKEIIEGNKLIAEFMGGKLKYFSITNMPYYAGLPYGRTLGFDSLKYNSSWDWLMSAWAKVGHIMYQDRGAYNKDQYMSANIITKCILSQMQKPDILKCFKYIVDAVKFLNNMKTIATQ